MAFEKVHMHRCTSSFVTATYEKVGLIPHDSCALPLKLFETPYCKYVIAAYVKIRLAPKALCASHLSAFERHAIKGYMLF
jgi:hypothetical protein